MRDELPVIDRFAQIGALAQSARHVLVRGFWVLVILTVFGESVLVFTGHPGAPAFALIAAGSLLLLHVWRQGGIGLPIVPVLALQALVAYGLPLINSNETVMHYNEADLTSAGVEVFVYCCSMAGFWRVGMQIFETSSPTCYAIQGFDEESMAKLARLGFGLMGTAAAFELLRSLELLNFVLSMFPSGSISIINVLLAAVSACGFFLSGMLVGRGGVGATGRLVFWGLLGLHCFISASAFLLSSTITIVFAALIGLFWGSGRVPWRFVILLLAVFSFLNLGKFTMRERYWKQGGSDSIPEFTLVEMPGKYSEWIEASIDSATAPNNPSHRVDVDEKKKGQSLGDRINNLQNILYVIDVMGPGRIPPLGGATYTLIPPLLIPRVIWPDKPRTHEGQIMLNVHFGRQDMVSTFTTYIAWGLLPEAYGNFGPIAGAIFIGGSLGFFFAWVEKLVARKLLLSMEGFLSFTLFLGMANSFEMVASVLITSIFQAFIPIVIASLPFTERVTPRRPEVAE